MADLEFSNAMLKGRKRALRLIARVARSIDDAPLPPSHDEIIDMCTRNTTSNCTTVPSYHACFPVAFSGEFLWQYWLTIAGPKWALQIIEDRQEVRFCYFWHVETLPLFPLIRVVGRLIAA